MNRLVQDILITIVMAMLWALLVGFIVRLMPAELRSPQLQKVMIWGIVVVAFVALNIWPLRRHLYATGLDNLQFGDKDGYGAFTALATFALAQGAALTAVPKGEDRTALVLSIYAVAVALTVLWISRMLSAVKDLPADGGTIRAYDRPSITYGRWAQFWTLIEAVVLIYLGTQGLLPNQTTRVPYSGGNRLLFALDIETVQKRYYRGGRSWYNQFLRRDLGGKQLFWFEQTEPFTANYTPFRITLVASDRYEVGEFQVFLARRDSSYPGFRLQEVAYIGRQEPREFDVVGANLDDFIVVLA